MRPRHTSAWGRLATLIAAYAFVLQTALAPIAAAAAAKYAATDAELSTICAEHTASGDSSVPASPHDHDAPCKFCVGCPATALLAPDSVPAATAGFAVATIHWHPSNHFVADKTWLGGKQARGPPALT
jgi:DUF2946 family protein